MKRQPRKSGPPKTEEAHALRVGARDVSAAEAAARAAGPDTLCDEEKAKLAAEVSRIEDA